MQHQATAMIVNVRVRGWLPMFAVLLLFVLFCPKDSVSFSVDTPPSLAEIHQTRRCTLYSHDGEHVLGTILERRSSNGVYEATIKNGGVSSMKEEEDSSVSQFVLPYFETADSVGSSTWPSSLAGAILLHCSTELQELTKDREVLELGSGLGLGGLVAGKRAARCVLSDNDEDLVERLGQHLENHKGSSFGDHFSVQKLDWRDSDPSNNVPEKEDRFDICLGFDVAYYYHLMGPLINTMKIKLKTNNAAVCILGQSDRESQWQLFHHIRDGGYNQITDEHEAPWEGSTRMLLYKLEMGTWCDGETGGETDTIDGFVPIAAILQTTADLSVKSITPYDRIATDEDENSQMMSF